MFGFLKGSRNDREYRQVYAGCCAVQHRWLGIESLFFLSYDAIFLYLLAIDAGKCSPPHEDSATCCRLRTNDKVANVVNSELAQFVAAFGLLLASIKLDDDVEDDGSLLARFARWRLRRRIEKSHKYFEAFDANFRQRVSDFLSQHAELENSATRHDLPTYCGPTANAFGYLFGLFAELVVLEQKEAFVEIGRSIGAALIAFDCAVDWEQDKARRRYNPLPDEKAVAAAVVYSQQKLSHGARICLDNFKTDRRGAALLTETFHRLSRLAVTTPRHTDPDVKPVRIPRPKRGRSVRRGDCGAICEMVAAISHGCQCCCESASSCPNCACGSCECTAHCCDGCCDEQSRKRQKIEESQKLVGMRGRAISAINPSGVVVVDGTRYPATTRGMFIEEDELIVVTGEESGSLLVERIAH